MSDQPAAAPAKLRLDKWLWHARFFKTRSLATKVVAAGHVRINGQHVAKPSVAVTAGDVVTFPQARDIRVIRVEGLGTRRGPAPEAQALYTDLSPPAPKPPEPKNPSFDGGGRPTKRDRRRMDRSRTSALE